MFVKPHWLSTLLFSMYKVVNSSVCTCEMWNMSPAEMRRDAWYRLTNWKLNHRVCYIIEVKVLACTVYAADRARCFYVTMWYGLSMSDWWSPLWSQSSQHRMSERRPLSVWPRLRSNDWIDIWHSGVWAQKRVKFVDGQNLFYHFKIKRPF